MTEVRARPKGEDGWVYEIYLEDEGHWSSPMGGGAARRLLRRAGFTEGQASTRLQRARRRHMAEGGGSSARGRRRGR